MFFNQRPPLLDRSCHIHSAVMEASRVLGTRTPVKTRFGGKMAAAAVCNAA